MSAQPYDDDALFTPSIRNERLPDPAPYRVGSTFYVGFFGGPIAATIVAVANAGRLGVQPQVRRNVALVGVIGLVATLVAGGALAGQESESGLTRLAVRILGIVTALVQARLLTPRERYWQGRGVQPSSLWALGIAAVVGGGITNAVLIAMLRGVL